jgi:hypothetical protein
MPSNFTANIDPEVPKFIMPTLTSHVGVKSGLGALLFMALKRETLLSNKHKANERAESQPDCAVVQNRSLHHLLNCLLLLYSQQKSEQTQWDYYLYKVLLSNSMTSSPHHSTYTSSALAVLNCSARPSSGRSGEPLSVVCTSI